MPLLSFLSSTRNTTRKNYPFSLTHQTFAIPLERNGLIRLNELRYWLEFIIPYENMGEERKLAPLMISIREKLMKLGT